jgi:CRP-like cAMP-binding protein
MAFHPEQDELRRIELFEVFEREALRGLLFGAETRLLRAGDILYRRGDAADGGHLLEKGLIALEDGASGPSADKIVRPIALLGEIALIAATTRPVTAIAREPSTVLRIQRTLFHRVLEKYPATAAQVRKLFKNRLAAFAEGLKFDEN